MSIKDMKREYRVDWVEWGNFYCRYYYRKNDAINFLEKIQVEPTVEDAQVVKV